MTLVNRQTVSGLIPVGAKSHRIDFERGIGIALALLLHIGMLVALLYISARPQIKPQLVQATSVMNMRLIPQAQITPAVGSPPKPLVQARPKPKPRPVSLKPTTVEPEPSPQVTPPAVPVTAPVSMALPPVQPASAGIVEQLPLAYLTRVMMTIGLNRRYPLKALANREQGIVVVHIHLLRDGSVLDVAVIKSSGYPALDDEARDVVMRVAKFQPLSAEYARGAEDFSIDQPIRFSGY